MMVSEAEKELEEIIRCAEALTDGEREFAKPFVEWLQEVAKTLTIDDET